jgi:hypothetical protein
MSTVLPERISRIRPEDSPFLCHDAFPTWWRREIDGIWRKAVEHANIAPEIHAPSDSRYREAYFRLALGLTSLISQQAERITALEGWKDAILQPLVDQVEINVETWREDRTGPYAPRPHSERMAEFTVENNPLFVEMGAVDADELIPRRIETTVGVDDGDDSFDVSVVFLLEDLHDPDDTWPTGAIEYTAHA